MEVAALLLQTQSSDARDCGPPAWSGRADNFSAWPPACTPIGADKFQYGQSSKLGIPCCAGMVSCPESRLREYQVHSVFDSVFACRKPQCCKAQAQPTVRKYLLRAKRMLQAS